MKDSTDEKSGQKLRHWKRYIAVASSFVQFAIFEVSGGMRVTQRGAEVTWTGNIEEIGGRGRRWNCGEEGGEKLFFVFYQKHRPFFKPGSVRAAVAAGIVVYRSRQRRYEY